MNDRYTKLEFKEIVAELSGKLDSGTPLGADELEILHIMIAHFTHVASFESAAVTSAMLFRRQIDDLYARINSLVTLLVSYGVIIADAYNSELAREHLTLIKSFIEKLENPENAIATEVYIKRGDDDDLGDILRDVDLGD